MKIITGEEPIPVEHPVFLVFGQPGIGKSSLGYSMKDVLTLDFDLGAHRAVNRRDTIQVPTWSVVEELMTSDEFGNYAAVCVDTVGRCLDVLTVEIITKDAKMGRAGNLTQQGWGQLKTRFKTWLTQLRAAGKDVLLIAHDKEDKDGDTRIVRPDIVGGSLSEVLKSADFVGYLFMQGKDRVLEFSPTDRWFGKNPAGWAPFVVPPAAKATAFMGDLYQKGRDALGHISEQSADALRAVNVWREKIAAVTTAKGCTELVALVNAIEIPMVKAQARTLLNDRAKDLHLKWDGKAHQFAAEPKAEPVGA